MYFLFNSWINLMVVIIRDVTNRLTMTQHRPVQTLCQAAQVSVLKCWGPLCSCVPHWPRFQLFSVWDNGRNGFITEHNTWVLFTTLVVELSWWCDASLSVVVFYLWNLLVRPAVVLHGFRIIHSLFIRSGFHFITNTKKAFLKSGQFGKHS